MSSTQITPQNIDTRNSLIGGVQSNPWSAEENAQYLGKMKGLFDERFQGNLDQESVDALEQIMARLIKGIQSPEDQTAPPLPAGEREAITAIKAQFADRFSELANDPKAFHQLVKQVYGPKTDQTAAESLRQQALAGDYSWLPQIEILDSQTIQGHFGAYDAENNVVYLNERLLANPEKSVQIYGEEVAHALDDQLSPGESTGDEGELFRRLLSDEGLSRAEMAAIRSENDHGVLTIDGRQVEVEFGWFSDAIDSVGDFVGDAVDFVGDAAEDVVDFVGDAAEDVVDFVGDAAEDVVDFVEDSADDIGDAFSEVGDFLEEEVLQSEWFPVVLAAASFVPGLNVVAAIGQAAYAGYNAYQGIETGNWQQAAFGIAGAFGGVAGAAGKFGASAQFVNNLQKVGDYVQTGVGLYQAVEDGDIVGLMSSAANLAPEFVDSDLVKVWSDRVQTGTQAYEAAERGDLLGAVGLGTGLLEDFTSEGTIIDDALGQISDKTLSARAVEVAIEEGDYAKAASLITDNYGDLLDLDDAQSDELVKLGATLSQMASAKELIEQHDYLGAAGALSQAVVEYAPGEKMQARLQDTAQALGHAGLAMEAVREGRYDDAVAGFNQALGMPLDNQTQAFLMKTAGVAQQAQGIYEKIESGDYLTAASYTSQLGASLSKQNPELKAHFDQTSTAINQADKIQGEIDAGNYMKAAELSAAFAATLTDNPELKAHFEQVAKILSGDVDSTDPLQINIENDGTSSTDGILNNYQVAEDEMVDWRPKLGPITGIDIPFTDPINITKTEAGLLDELGERKGLLGLKQFSDIRDSAYAKADEYFSQKDEKGNPIDGAEDGHNDAFRHTYWNALMTREFGEGFAKSFATAHEGVPGNNADREAMDLYNNELGRRIAMENPDASNEELARLVFDAVNKGETVVIDRNNDLVHSDQEIVGATGKADDPARGGGQMPPEWAGSL